MTIMQAMEARHSVRAYKDEPIPAEIRQKLDTLAEECSREKGLHIFIRYDDPDGFDSRMAHYGSFRGVKNYIVLAGKKRDGFETDCGYMGEKLVLFAQQLGLKTCWAALTFNKKKVRALLQSGESLLMVIALGYGESAGTPHRGKGYSDAARADDPPDWFKAGVEAALLAPTAVNQQKFVFTFKDGKAFLSAKGFGFYLDTDLGIVKYHFEAASGHEAVIE